MLKHSTEISKYESLVVELRDSFSVSGDFSREKWKEVYETLDADDTVEQLPLALSLIHPDFWDGCDFETSREHQPLAFKESRSWRDNHSPVCNWWGLLGEGRLCKTKSSVEADHIWPKSLGGLKANGNFQPLCELHNKMKGNSVLLFDWTVWPIWLRGLLQQIDATYS